MNNYKKYSMLLCSLGLMLLLVGTTYSFFNYTKTGNPNNFTVGRISFETKNEQTITLNNLFPIDPSNTDDLNDSTKVGTYSIGITGDTDYSDGIEYLVSITDANIYTSTGKTIPISLNITTTGLGNENNNYFTARESKNNTIYKRLIKNTLVGDGMIMVGFIKPNTESGTIEGVNGSITIKAYLDKNNILISDTYDGTESDSMGTTNSKAAGKTVLTTTEWNSISSTGISFKVKVEANQGIWVNGSLEEIMRKSAVSDNISSTFVSASTGINFGSPSSDTNGKGVYIKNETIADTNPILYYRGAVEDNNVIFANKCWKAVRTTDTGGVKLIYNGELSTLSVPLDESDYTILTNSGLMSFDTTEKAWVFRSTSNYGQGTSLEISFSVPSGDDYIMEIFGDSGTSLSGTVFRGTNGSYQAFSGFGGVNGNPITTNTMNYNAMSTGDSAKVTYYGTASSEQEVVLKIRMIHKDETAGVGCDNQGASTQLSTEVNNTITNTFPFSGENMSKSISFIGYMRGDTYLMKQTSAPNGTLYGSSYQYNNGTYTLIDTSSTFSTTRRYSCLNSTGVCQDNVKFIFYFYQDTPSSTANNIDLQNGEKFEDALAKMRMNTTDSNAKSVIDNWYHDNLVEYTNKLEDTIYCNDRSNPELDDLSLYIYNNSYFSTRYRYEDNTLSLSCQDKNDRFTVNNSSGNRKLTYPVGMITSDEVMLVSPNGHIASGSSFWTMSPALLSNFSMKNFSINSYGQLDDSNSNHIEIDYPLGLRPVISIKPGQPIVRGSGTVSDPYVIE